ncbi:MAG TPA: type II secretion system protein, partial [Phycisphaerae bacterium]|nr:type II secretion system protein [Phycisphaerae bacterium]
MRTKGFTLIELPFGVPRQARDREFRTAKLPVARRRKGKAFTLIELLVVVAIIGLLVTILTPGLQKALELARRAKCAANLHNIGVGLSTYVAADGRSWPWLTANNNWNAATGQNESAAPSTATAYNVSSLLFLLVREGQGTGIFICPSTDDTPDRNTRTDGRLDWDFSASAAGQGEHVSYSYQGPLNMGTAGSPAYASGVSGASGGGLIIAADRTPGYRGKTA